VSLTTLSRVKRNMSILASIKGEKKLSFGNWRYRLLHWCFNVKDADPKRPQDTGLPKFLYTHYCPLFHLTNLIAILSPLVLFIKVMAVIVKAAVSATAAIDWSKLDCLVSWMRSSKCTSVNIGITFSKRTPEEERMLLLEYCRKWNPLAEDDFEAFWAARSLKFETLSKDEVEFLYREFMPKIAYARLEGEQRRAALREKLIFWTNFSRVFIKWGLNVFYVFLTIGVAYLAYLASVPVWHVLTWIADGILWLFTDEGSLDFLKMFAKTMAWLVVGAGTGILLARISWLQNFGSLCYKGCVVLSPPFYLLGKFGGWVADGVVHFLDFAAMFYEENCPTITIISEEEAVIEKIIEKEGE